MSSTERFAIVTGAGQGIGREIARVLALAGNTVLIADVNAKSAAAVEAEIVGGKSEFAQPVHQMPDFGRAQ